MRIPEQLATDAAFEWIEENLQFSVVKGKPYLVLKSDENGILHFVDLSGDNLRLQDVLGRSVSSLVEKLTEKIK